MSNTQQPEALRIADSFDSFSIDHKPTGWPAVQQRELSAAAAALRRLNAENTALQAGYDAARLEIESLRAERQCDTPPPLCDAECLYTHPSPQQAAPAEGDPLDAARYRYLRKKVAIAGSRFHILNLDPLEQQQRADLNLDAAIDAAMAAQIGEHP